MFKNRPRTQPNDVRTITALSDLGLFHELIELILITLGALKIFALKLDPPYEFARVLHGRDGPIEFVWVEPNILHALSSTLDLNGWERF